MHGWICERCGFHNENENGVYCNGCGVNRHKVNAFRDEERSRKKESSYFENTGKFKRGKKR